MTQSRAWLLAFSLVAFASVSAYAGSSASASPTLDFTKADANHDGKVSRAEFDAAVKSANEGATSASGGSSSSSHTNWNFEAADKNHDGSLSRQEFDDLTKSAGSSSSAASSSAPKK